MSGFGAALGGGILSSIGGLLGGQSANRAGRQAKDLYTQQTNSGTNRYWNSLYGAGGGGRAGMDAFTTGTSGPPTPSSDSLLGQQQGLANLYGQKTGGINSQFGQGVAGLNNLYGGSEGLAEQYGRGGEALIDQETARTLKGANQSSAAQLAASGFGNSTAGANQSSQNAINANLAGSEAKLNLRNQALQTRLGVRGQQAGAQQTNIGRQADLSGNQLNNQMGYSQQPIQTQLSALNSSVMNPFLGQNTSQYYPGYSAAGTALANSGNALGTYGGYQALSSLYGPQQGAAPAAGQFGGASTYGGSPFDPTSMYGGNAYA